MLKRTAVLVVLLSISVSAAPSEEARALERKPGPTGPAGQACDDFLEQVNRVKPLWSRGASLRLPTEQEREDLGELWPSIPTHENAAFLYGRAMEHLRYLAAYPAGSVSRDVPYCGDVVELKGYVADHASALALLTKASKLERCRFPPLISSQTVRIESGSRNANMRQFTRLLADAAFVAEAEGRLHDAAEFYLLPLKMAVHLCQGNVLDSLVGHAVAGMGLGSLEHLVANGGLSRTTLERILSEAREWEIAPQDCRQPIEKDLLQTRWNMTRDEWEAVRGMLRRSVQLTGTKLPETREQFVALQRRYRDNVSEALREPFHVVLAEGYAVDERVREGIPRDSWRIAGIGIKISDYLKIWARQEARLRGLQIRAAIQMYILDYGAPPDALEALRPDYVQELPLDPFSGKSFSYRKTDQDWVLYSVGENLVDDGGACDRSQPTAKWADIVFPAQLPTNLELRMRR